MYMHNLPRNSMRRHRPVYALLLGLSLLLCTTGETLAEQFFIKGSTETDSVHFESDASLEFIEGFTQSIRGKLSFNPSNTTDSVSGHLRVEAATLKTGIELRDEHMRENHLHTDKYPYIEFTLTSVNGLPDQLPSGSPISCEIEGEFTVHGTTKSITAPCEVTLVKSDPTTNEHVLQVRANFEILLDDYGIPRPKALFMKLAEQINIRVHFIASNKFAPVEF